MNILKSFINATDVFLESETYTNSTKYENSAMLLGKFYGVFSFFSACACSAKSFAILFLVVFLLFLLVDLF